MRNIMEIKKSAVVSSKIAEAINPSAKRWMNFPNAEKQVNIHILRILGLLFNEDQTRGWGYTKSQIVAMLNVWEDQVDYLLDQLQSQEFLYSEQIPFGMDLFGRRRKVRIYQITELGRFYIHQLDTQFPGIWMTKIGKNQ